MVPRSDFVLLVKKAYDHLYDLVFLRSHTLNELLIPDQTLSGNERAWAVHRLLLEVIDELDPGPNAPLDSPEWQRHRLMAYRYVEGMTASETARRLGISRRHYYRRHKEALTAVTRIMWERHGSSGARTLLSPTSAMRVYEPLDHIQLIRLEAARLNQSERFAELDDVIRSVPPLLQNVLQQRDLTLAIQQLTAKADIRVDRVVFRQVLLAVLALIAERSMHAELRIQVELKATEVHLIVTSEPPEALEPTMPQNVSSRLLPIEEMAEIIGTRVLPIRTGELIGGFVLILPVEYRRMVLVVDDNNDVLELFQRYLVNNGFQVVVAHNGPEALALARRFQPYAITLDLMMSGQDGWDILQVLLNQEDTKHIPIIVCSVLKQRELALSLGAALFLDKPVTETTLVAALDALDCGKAKQSAA
jgi:CheY-like chemotaxis protein/DNA-directed RNA polymerase specialized sigma24 family protein